MRWVGYVTRVRNDECIFLVGKGEGKDVSWNASNKACLGGEGRQWTYAVLWLPLIDTLGNTVEAAYYNRG
jgi:hypothetical protein